MKNLSILMAFALLGLFLACKNTPAGEKAVTDAAKKVETKASNASHKVLSGSVVQWTGSKLAGEHSGTLNISSGDVQVSDKKVTGGKFYIDMGSLKCTDLEAGKGKEKLEGHLKSADFFDVANNPESTFEITSVSEGNVTGNLTMMGVSKSVTFPATITVSDSGVTVRTPAFTINRTDWGIKYGSASFFDGLKDKAVSDDIALQIMMKAR